MSFTDAQPTITTTKRTPAAGRANGHRLTRRRIPLSCVACRVRKLKCNREKPCQNCIVRGEGIANSCVYAEKIEKKMALQSNPRSDAEDMRKRLNRLETSILSMLTEKDRPKAAHSRTCESPSVIEVPDQAVGQKLSDDTRSTHWDAILNELGAMKEAWSEENDKIEYTSNPQSPASKMHRPGLLAGLTPPPDRATILASIPSREASDTLILQFFESYNPAIPARYVLHKATFLKQYSQHWANPTNTKIMWIGLLFSIYTIAMKSYIMSNQVPVEYQGTAPAVTELYRVRTVQCLVIADITKPADFMIETLDLHSFAEYSEEGDGDMGTCLISGIMMRLALQQAYHRDPSHHPNISIFQGEMRRRVWSAISQHELLFSVQLGLPKAIRYAEADTEPPRNLYEEELYEDMTELPPSRPLTEDTEVSYQVVKWQIMRAFGRVIEFLNIIEPQPYEEVLKLDLVLLEARTVVPPHLQLGTLEDMKSNTPSRVVEKYILDIFYHKAVCVLHRKYWNAVPKDTSKTTWYYSRKTCVSSALALLGHQVTMHQACAPGGCMLPLKWYHFSITNHDFLLAAMILCLDVMNNLHERGETAPDCIVSDSDKIDAIKSSCTIWTEIVDDCRDAKRAVKILTSVLQKIAAKTEQRKNVVSPSNDNMPAKQVLITTVSVEMIPKTPFFLDGLEFGIPTMNNQTSQSGSSYSQASPDDGILFQDSSLDNMGSDLSIPADFNWDTWDLFMAGQTPASIENLYEASPDEFQPTSGIASMENPVFRYPFIEGCHLSYRK